MKRLTARDKHGHAYYPKCFEYPCEGERKCCTYTAKNDCEFEGKVLEQLTCYEETGLSPYEINELKLNAKNNGWIPVAERLPEYDGEYTVCLDDGYITTVAYCTGKYGKQDWELWADSGDVIAWQPLPEPYKED